MAVLAGNVGREGSRGSALAVGGSAGSRCGASKGQVFVAWAAAGALPGLLVVVGVVLAGLGVVAPGAALVVVALVLAALALRAGSPRRLLGMLATRPAHAGGEARLVNLVEALCVTDGLPVPQLVVLEDPAANLILFGRSPRDATLVVTSGLLVAMDRMELEALIAHELAHAKRGDLRIAAAGSSAFGLFAGVAPSVGRGVLRLAGSTREVLADQAAVRLTRYPPALASALDKLAGATSTRPAGLSPTFARLTGALWCAPLDEARPRRPLIGVLDLADRAAALREL